MPFSWYHLAITLTRENVRGHGIQCTMRKGYITSIKLNELILNKAPSFVNFFYECVQILIKFI